MVFDYNGNGDATAACIFNRSQTYVTASSTCSGAALKTGYGYTTISSKVYLTSATDVLGNTTTYTQSVYGGVTCIKPPRLCQLQGLDVADGGAGLFADARRRRDVDDWPRRQYHDQRSRQSCSVRWPQ